MKEFNATLKCTAYRKEEAIHMTKFIKGMEDFNGCPNSTHVNMSVNFKDEGQLLANKIDLEISMNHVADDDEGLEILFDWNARLEQQKICKIQYTSLTGITE